MIAGLELPTSGEILIDGEDVSQRPASQRDIAMVFQMIALYPHMSVRKNIAYPLVSQGIPRTQVQEKVAEVARILRIDHLLDKGVGGLSGGDRQRVALGRAIVRNPKAFMMDEPLGALDAEFREIMAEELRALHDRMHATTVYVTHDQLEAMQMGDKIVVMNHGVVEQFGTPQAIYDHPATLFVADFIGSPAMNFLRFEGQAAAGAGTITLGDIPVALPQLQEPASGTLVLGVRPEHVSLSDAAPLKGRIEAAEYLGTTQIVTLSTPYGQVKARTPSTNPARPGDLTGLALNSPRLALFDATTGRAFRTAANAGVHHG
jgi:multiple sugar transport system ATP-binding protein